MSISNLEWRMVDYCIAKHYLPALINADYSGLDEADSDALADFLKLVTEDAREAGYIPGHWDCDVDDETYFRYCDVCELRADCVQVRFCMYRKA